MNFSDETTQSYIEVIEHKDTKTFTVWKRSLMDSESNLYEDKKKSFKKIKRDKKRNFIFENEINLNGIKSTRWKYILKYCFFEGNKIPKYFNNHQIYITKDTKRMLAKRLRMLPNDMCMTR